MDPITIDDFAKADLRVGEILTAVKVEWSEKLIKMEVDFGNPLSGGGKKIVFSGILKWYQPEELVGKQAVFVINLPEKKIREEISQAMILTAYKAETDTLSILMIDKKMDNGTKVE